MYDGGPQKDPKSQHKTTKGNSSLPVFENGEERRLQTDQSQGPALSPSLIGCYGHAAGINRKRLPDAGFVRLTEQGVDVGAKVVIVRAQ